ncbi:ferruginol synthase [Capsicum galapagoense]
MISPLLNELDLVALAILFLSLTILWHKLTSNVSQNEKHRLPPGPRGLPIVGFLPFLRPSLHYQLTELSQKYGPIYKLWLGSRLFIVLNSPSLAKEVFCDQDTVFANRDPSIAAFVASYGGLDIVFSPYGSYWRDMRKLFVREMLSNRNLEASYSHRKHEIRKAIRSVHTKIGSQIDISELAFVTEINVIMSIIFGSNFGDEMEKHGKIGRDFRELVVKIPEMSEEPNISDFFPILARFDLQGIKNSTEALIKSFDCILDPVLNERMKMISEGQIRRSRNKDFIQILLELMEQKETQISVDLVKIKAILIDLVIGGTDTTTTMVEWVMAELLNNSDKMAKVQQGLKHVIGLNHIVEESHLPKLHYLDAVIKETLRLHPAFPMLQRICPSQSTIVGGYTVPQDTKVILNVYAIHRDPQVWENPLEFQPERFLMSQSTNNLNYSGNNYKYLPFGSGRRSCAGVALADKMLMFMEASFLHSFDWQLPEGEKVDLSDGHGFVIKKKTPLFAIPTPRLPNLELYQ